MARKNILAEEWLWGRFKRRFSKRQWMMLFGGRAVFGGSGVEPWYLSGGIDPSASVAAYLPIGKTGLLTSYINENGNAAYNATVGGKPVFSTQTGWKFLNTLSQFLRTGIIPKPINQDWSVICAIQYDQNGVPFGIINENTAPFPQFYINPVTVRYIQGAFNTQVNVAPAIGSGASAILGFAGRKPFRNGVPDGAGLMTVGTNTNSANAQLFIGGANKGDNTVTSPFTGKIQALAFYNVTLTDAQMLAVTNAIIALKAITYPYYGKYFIGFGDSKTSDSWLRTANNSASMERTAILNTDIEWTRINWGVASRTTAQWAAAIDAQLAGWTPTQGPEYILYNMGANDVQSLPAEATWKADTQYVLDAMHSKWPTSIIYMAKVWRRTYGTECGTLNGWIDDLIALNSTFVSAGHNEAVWMEGGDDGATMTSDGIHPSAAGYTELVAQWKTILGYT